MGAKGEHVRHWEQLQPRCVSRLALVWLGGAQPCPSYQALMYFGAEHRGEMRQRFHVRAAGLTAGGTRPATQMFFCCGCGHEISGSQPRETDPLYGRGYGKASNRSDCAFDACVRRSRSVSAWKSIVDPNAVCCCLPDLTTASMCVESFISTEAITSHHSVESLQEAAQPQQCE